MIGSLILPMALPNFALTMASVDEALPFPFPIFALFLALLMGVSWLTAGQAALAIARDCPLLPWEENERRTIENELTVLGASSGNASGLVADASMDEPPPLRMPNTRLNPSTNLIAPRPSFPVDPASHHRSPVPTPGGTLQYETMREPLNPMMPATPASRGPRSIDRAPAPLGSRPPAPAAFGSRTPAPSPSRAGTHPPITGRTPGSPMYQTPAAATPPSGSRRLNSGGALSYRAPGSAPTPPSGRRLAAPGSGGAYNRAETGSYTLKSETIGDPNTGGSFEGPAASWRGPRFGHVEEPWLADALQKAQALSARYPVQAFLEYSVEPDLPFTLVLERATPAMAVRAMVDFVGFLASISPPRRARIELRSVVHLDRSFYRSVMSAMEPYFPDSVEIRQQGYRVEITFLEPDRNWARYPILPIEE
ncbi:MAG: hypothetical protein AB8H79_25620 [Myxococcota bacterium]